MVVDETGGIHGVRDSHAILSLEHAPRQVVFGKELFPTAFKKAAVYARDIIMNHPFLDGNKRTGMTAAVAFLENNGFIFQAREGEVERFALRIVKKHLVVAEIARWLKKHSRKLKR